MCITHTHTLPRPQPAAQTHFRKSFAMKKLRRLQECDMCKSHLQTSSNLPLIFTYQTAKSRSGTAWIKRDRDEIPLLLRKGDQPVHRCMENIQTKMATTLFSLFSLRSFHCHTLLWGCFFFFFPFCRKSHVASSVDERYCCHETQGTCASSLCQSGIKCSRSRMPALGTNSSTVLHTVPNPRLACYPPWTATWHCS